MVEEVLTTESTAVRGINSEGVFELIKSEDGALDVNLHRLPAQFYQGSFLNGVAFTPLVADLPHSDAVVSFGLVPVQNNSYTEVTLNIEASLNNINWFPIANITLPNLISYYEYVEVHQASFVRLTATDLTGDSVQLFMSVR